MKEDCFYFITSTCSKKNVCQYRHSEKAKASTKTCSNWLNKNPCTNACPNRHSNYQEKEKINTRCIWEIKGECTRKDCPYIHWNKIPNLLNLSELNIQMNQM
ncbi:hypothetical protein NEFER03_1694 [Nematocida sp. LUAm3]|nr:hypothetical protein NEFER03_1694 [Nematocida sp. LUAm3]KAI5175684.1 hypothetical protein NEFER02_1571 [Nematocida sp. LUAm2]KAI5178590.1 hypothetical protein NEFER01_1726 [Nematocida sp. LUAm1]